MFCVVAMVLLGGWWLSQMVTMEFVAFYLHDLALSYALLACSYSLLACLACSKSCLLA